MTRGGKREGAGRPPGDPDLVKIPLATKLPAWLVAWLREQDEPIAVLIEEALVKTHKLQGPRSGSRRKGA